MKLSPGKINTLALGIASGINFLSLVLWTHYLNPAQFGLYALISASALFLNATIFEWLRMSALRLIYDKDDPLEISEAVANAAAAIGLVLLTALMTVAIALWLGGVSLFGITPDWWIPIWLWLSSEMFFAISVVMARLRLMSWRFFALMILRAVLSLVIGAGLVIFADLGAVGVVIGILAAQFFVPVMANIIDPAWRRLRPFRARRTDLVQILTYGVPLIASAGLGYASFVSDRFIISALLGDAATGQYAVAADLMQKTVIFLMLTINLTAFPALVRCFEAEGQPAGERKLAQTFLVYLTIAAPAAVGFAVLSPGIARIFVGPDFRHYVAMLLPWVAPAAILRGLTTFYLSVGLQLVKKTKLMILSPLITLIILIPAGIFGAMTAGLTGMVVSTLVAQAVSFVIFALIVSRHIQLSMFNMRSAAICLLAIGIGLCLWPFRQDAEVAMTLGLLAVAGLVYAGVLWLGRHWLKQEAEVGG